MRALLAGIGAWGLDIARDVGAMGLTVAAVTRRLIPPRLDGRETLRAMHRAGVLSMPIVIVVAMVAGAIMVVQAGMYVRALGAYHLLGHLFARRQEPLLQAVDGAGQRDHDRRRSDKQGDQRQQKHGDAQSRTQAAPAQLLSIV